MLAFPAAAPLIFSDCEPDAEPFRSIEVPLDGALNTQLPVLLTVFQLVELDENANVLAADKNIPLVGTVELLTATPPTVMVYGTDGGIIIKPSAPGSPSGASRNIAAPGGPCVPLVPAAPAAPAAPGMPGGP